MGILIKEIKLLFLFNFFSQILIFLACKYTRLSIGYMHNLNQHRIFDILHDYQVNYSILTFHIVIDSTLHYYKLFLRSFVIQVTKCCFISEPPLARSLFRIFCSINLKVTWCIRFYEICSGKFYLASCQTVT